MRRQKVDPLEKLLNVFAQKVKKGRLWPPAANEVEKVVSNLHFSNPPDFFRSIWFFSDPPDFFRPTWFFSVPPACQQHHRWDNWLNQHLRWKRWPRILNCWINVNYFYVFWVSLNECVPSKQWRREVQLRGKVLLIIARRIKPCLLLGKSATVP